MTERMTPECATTSAAAGAPSARAMASSAMSRSAASRALDDGVERLERRRPVVFVEPTRPPGLDLGRASCPPTRRRAPRATGRRCVGAPSASASPMIAAVSAARLRSLAQSASKTVSMPASVHAVSIACSRPSAVNGESAVPCQRCTAFHSLWPCRSSSTVTRPSWGPSSRDVRRPSRWTSRRRVPAPVRWGRWPSSVSSLRPVMPRAPHVMCCPAPRSVRCSTKRGVKYGDRFDAVLGTCKIWVNGEPAGTLDAIGSADELAVLPPVSGGATAADGLGGTW